MQREPIISPDPAMLGRVQVVPFRASFLGREDPTVEPEMKKEAPGILYRWMIAAREFLEIGLRPPQCVLDATKELFAEGDLVGRFIRERLNFAPSGYTTSEDLRLAYSLFVNEIGQPDTYVEMNPLQRRLKTYPGCHPCQSASTAGSDACGLGSP
jgi:hypothetical protein